MLSSPEREIVHVFTVVLKNIRKRGVISLDILVIGSIIVVY